MSTQTFDIGAISIEDIPTGELLKLENQICFPLYACSKEVVRAYTPYLERLNLTYTQYLVMLALWEYGDMSVGEMGERLYLDSGTLTPLLKKMEGKGFLQRIRSDGDARRVEVKLTEKGQAMKEDARDIPLSMGRCVDINPRDAQELVRLLRLVLGNVHK